jgi:hypothetical protein
MAVPRTPRPPIIAPKPARAVDINEVERWVGRLARSIRLKRLEQGFLGGSTKQSDAQAGSATLADHDAAAGG